MKESLRIGWSKTSASFPFAEVMDEPSMTEPSPSISLEQMVRDYSRGIIHSSRVAYYDNGEEIEDPTEPEDISEVFEYAERIRKRKPGKTPPDQAPSADPEPPKNPEPPDNSSE